MNILEGRLNENQFVECLQRHVPFYLSHLIDRYSKHHNSEHLGETLLVDLCRLCYLPDLLDDGTLDMEEKYYCLSLAIQANKQRIQSIYETVG